MNRPPFLINNVDDKHIMGIAFIPETSEIFVYAKPNNMDIAIDNCGYFFKNCSEWDYKQLSEYPNKYEYVIEVFILKDKPFTTEFVN